MTLDTWFFLLEAFFSKVSTTRYENSYFSTIMTKVWSENNVYFFYTVCHITKVYFFGPYFNTPNSGTTTLNLVIPTSKLFPPNFHKKSKKQYYWSSLGYCYLTITKKILCKKYSIPKTTKGTYVNLPIAC